MPDRKKVIKGLEYCFATANCDGCPYEIECRKIPFKTPENHCPILDDVLALLKEQEPQLVLNIGEQISCKSGSCPKCGKMLNTTCNKRYCGDCGQAVKW